MIALVLTAPLALASALPTSDGEYVLELQRQAGTALRYVHSVDHMQRVEEIVTVLPDREEPGVVRPKLEARGGARVEFVDELRATENGVPLRLRRRYEAGRASLEMLDVREEADNAPDTPLSRAEFTSDLVGASVVHVHTSKGWGRHYDGREARESLLPLTAGDLEWAALLPGAAVDIGSTWNVDPSALRVLFAPVAELGWRGEDGSDPELERSFRAGLGGNLHFGFDGGARGEVTATLHEVRVEGKERRAVVRYRFDLVLEASHTEMAQRRMTEDERGMGVDVGDARSTRGLVGTASLEWDLVAGRPVRAAGTAEESLELRVLVRSNERGDSATQTLSMKGPLAFDLTCEPAELTEPPGPRPARVPGEGR